MSVRCLTHVFEKSGHAGSDLLMLLALADYSDDDGNSYPAVPTLARKCRMTSRNANYILKALQDSGELRVLKNQGPKGTNRYRILLSQLGLSKPLKQASVLKATSPLKPTSRTPEAGFLKPLKPLSDEPSLNRHEPSTSKTTLNGFDMFYKAYPRRVGKEAAEKAFVKSNAKVFLPAILLDIDRRLSCGEWITTKEKMQFIPHPSTYLNGKRWEDEQDGDSGGGGVGILPGAI